MTASRDFDTAYSQFANALGVNRAAHQFRDASLAEVSQHGAKALQDSENARIAVSERGLGIFNEVKTLSEQARQGLSSAGLSEPPAPPPSPLTQRVTTLRELEETHGHVNEIFQVVQQALADLQGLHMEFERRKRARQRLIVSAALLGVTVVVIGITMVTIAVSAGSSPMTTVAARLTASPSGSASPSNVSGQGSQSLISSPTHSDTTAQAAQVLQLQSLSPTHDAPIPTHPSATPNTAGNSGSLPVATTSLSAIVINTARLNVRQGPGPEYAEVTMLSTGQSVTVVGRNTDGSWVNLSGGDRWVNAQYLNVNGDILGLPVTFSESGDWGIAGTATGARAHALQVLRIRGGPGSDYRQLSNPDTLRVGQTVDIIGKSADGLWYQVNISNRSGWISSQYVRLTGNTNAYIPVTGG